MSQVEDRLKALGIALPVPPMPVASYVPFMRSGKHIHVSGQLPMLDGALKYAGKLGQDISLEQGQAAAQLCAINLIAQAKSACGDLDRIVAWLRLGVFVNAVPDYTKHPEVANGASDLVAAVFADAGRHARAAVGVGSLPRGAAVEVEAVFEIA